MALLERHLEQIELCSSTIAELPFPPPKIFTNALLRTHDITALIRDTEAHERALFSIGAPDAPPSSSSARGTSARRTTLFPAADSDAPAAGASAGAGAGSAAGSARAAGAVAAFRPPRRNTAVAAVLGGDMALRLRRERGGEAAQRQRPRAQGDELDVELLLQGAEKLCAAYPMKGIPARIAALRARHAKVSTSIASYESLVAEQTAQLKAMSRPTSFNAADEDDADGETGVGAGEGGAAAVDDGEDGGLGREEESIRELERRKRALEERVSGMERDLGGLMR